MEKLLKLTRVLSRIGIVVIFISILLFIAIVVITNDYAEKQAKNKICDNSTYILSNYSNNSEEASYPLISEDNG